jgi:hypothetical protein
MQSNLFVQNIIQQGIYSLAISLILLYATTLPKRSLFFSAIAFMVIFCSVSIPPIHRGSSLVEILRGGINDLSTTSGLFMICLVARLFKLPHSRKILSWWEKLPLLIIGLTLYLSTFGFISFDIYHLGYLSTKMLLFFSSLTLLLILLNRKLGYIWLIAIVAYSFHAQSSNNLWDYLYDPILWLVIFSDGLTKTTSYISNSYFNKHNTL